MERRSSQFFLRQLHFIARNQLRLVFRLLAPEMASDCMTQNFKLTIAINVTLLDWNWFLRFKGFLLFSLFDRVRLFFPKKSPILSGTPAKYKCAIPSSLLFLSFNTKHPLVSSQSLVVFTTVEMLFFPLIFKRGFCLAISRVCSRCSAGLS